MLTALGMVRKNGERLCSGKKVEKLLYFNNLDKTFDQILIIWELGRIQELVIIILVVEKKN